MTDMLEGDHRAGRKIVRREGLRQRQKSEIGMQKFTKTHGGGRRESTAVGQDWGPRWWAVGVYCWWAGLWPPLVGGGRLLPLGRTVAHR